MDRTFFGLGALAGGIGVMLGAFGAHALAGQITPERLATFETAVRYQMIHALALLVVALAAAGRPGRALWAAGWLFAVGILIFSGSLYLLVATGQGWLGAVTPLGGLAFILGWAALAWVAWADR